MVSSKTESFKLKFFNGEFSLAVLFFSLGQACLACAYNSYLVLLQVRPVAREQSRYSINASRMGEPGGDYARVGNFVDSAWQLKADE